MSTSFNEFSDERDWWERLGLRHVGVLPTSRQEFHVQAAVLEVLRMHPPTAFVDETAGEALPLAELAVRVRRTAEAAEAEGARQYETQADEQRKLGWEQIEQALRGRDAGEPVTDGRWSGFTRGEATAWCWNLFQYEPHGFTHPGSEVRVRSMAKLRAGQLPEVFGYPERARELAAQGLTPREYRRHQEALGAAVYIHNSASVMSS